MRELLDKIYMGLAFVLGVIGAVILFICGIIPASILIAVTWIKEKISLLQINVKEDTKIAVVNDIYEFSLPRGRKVTIDVKEIMEYNPDLKKLLKVDTDNAFKLDLSSFHNVVFSNIELVKHTEFKTKKPVYSKIENTRVLNDIYALEVTIKIGNESILVVYPFPSDISLTINLSYFQISKELRDVWCRLENKIINHIPTVNLTNALSTEMNKIISRYEYRIKPLLPLSYKTLIDTVE